MLMNVKNNVLLKLNVLHIQQSLLKMIMVVKSMIAISITSKYMDFLINKLKKITVFAILRS